MPRRRSWECSAVGDGRNATFDSHHDAYGWSDLSGHWPFSGRNDCIPISKRRTFERRFRIVPLYLLVAGYFAFRKNGLCIYSPLFFLPQSQGNLALAPVVDACTPTHHTRSQHEIRHKPGCLDSASGYNYFDSGCLERFYLLTGGV